MSTPDEFAPGVKTLGVKLQPDVHAQLSFIAGLRPGRGTITDEIQIAVAAHIRAAKDDPELQGRAVAARAEIEREAAARQQAIASLFDAGLDTATGADQGRAARRPQRGGEGTPQA